MTHRTASAAALALALVLVGCPPRTRTVPMTAAPPLRVGVTVESPPIAFMQGGELTGFEPEFAHELGRALKRPVRFVELPWDDQIPALLDRRTDIIMSGMTITPAREVRINFTEPYVQSGLMALILRSKRDKYDSVSAVLAMDGEVGVRRDTTAELFVRERIPKAHAVTYLSSKDAVMDLKQGRINVYVDDAPIIVWLVSENESELALVHKPLNQERLGWGVRREDDDLRHAANVALVRWKANGTLDQILKRWLPYWPDRDD